MGATTIEWTDHSINPIRARDLRSGGVGHYCEKISTGCKHCYASRLQPRFKLPEFFGANPKYPSLPEVDDLGRVRVDAHRVVVLDESKLAEVLARKKPTRYFWCDMTDLFGSWVPDGWIDRCFATMALTPQHTHQVLTKRTELMAAYLVMIEDERDMQRWGNAAAEIANSPCASGRIEDCDWPLPNVWLGTSCENQPTADERIPHLLNCPAAVRFLSCEPLLGPIDLEGLLTGECRNGIGWVIVGGESGPHARPMAIQWARDLRDQCQAAGVPFFFKRGSQNNWSDFKNFNSFPSDLQVREFPGGSA